MTLDSEDAVKKALGISSFRELSKEKALALYAAIPDMANEVRMKLIEQIPAVQKFALDAVTAIEHTLDKTADSVDKNQVTVHDAMSDVRSVLKGELDREDISEEHRRFLVEQVVDSGKVESQSASEGQKLIAEQAGETRKAVIIVAGMAIVAGVVLGGGKVMLGRSGSTQL